MWNLGRLSGFPPQKPPAAAKTERARQFWGESAFSRGTRWALGLATEQDVEELLLVGIESYTHEDLRRAVFAQEDVVPRLVRYAGLEYQWVLRIAKAVLKNNWATVQGLLVGTPPLGADDRVRRVVADRAAGLLVQRIGARDPVAGGLLASPQGWPWFLWSVWNIQNLARSIARIDGFAIPPPRLPCPLLERAALEGGYAPVATVR